MKKAVFYISILFTSWVYSTIFNNVDWDFWARISVGKIFFQLGHVLKHDIFAYSDKKLQWIDHEWGSGVIFYFLSDHFGDAGIVLFKILSIMLVLFLISKIVEMYNPKPKAHLNILFYLFSFTAMTYGFAQTARCQYFTFIFFALWIYVLERVRRGEKRLLWIIPATMLIWANVHGGFVAGIGLLLMYAAGEFLNGKSFKKYLYILIPTGLITLINPYGFKYLEYVFTAVTMKRPHIVEWFSSFDHGLQSYLMYKLFLLASIIVVIYSFYKNRPKYSELDKVKFILLLATAYLSIKHIKHQSLFAITAASFLYHDFYALFERLSQIIKQKWPFVTEKQWNYIHLFKSSALYTFIIITGLFCMVKYPLSMQIKSYQYPAKSIEFIKQNKIKGNLLTVLHWGSYAEWKLYPQNLNAIDGRYEEVFKNQTHLMAINFMFQKNRYWYDFVRKYHTDIILVDTGYKSYIALEFDPRWKQIYHDNCSAVFVRKEKARNDYKMPDMSYSEIDSKKYENNINFL